MKCSSFVFYASFHEATKELDDAEYGTLMRAINEYALNDVMPELNGMLKMAFILIKPQIDANIERRETGKGGGRPSLNNDVKNEIIQELQNGETQKAIAEKHNVSQSAVSSIKNEISKTQNKISKTIVYDNCDYHKPNVNVNVNVNDNVNDNDNGDSPPKNGGHSPPEKTPPDSESLRLSQLLFTLHKKYDSAYGASKRRIETWACDIEKLHRIDGRKYSDIEGVIRWVKTDGNFWFSNIMSGAKLREQFSRLCVQMAQDNNHRQGRGNAVDKSGVDRVDIDSVDIPF